MTKKRCCRLTSRANDAIFMASGVETRCTQRQLATVKAANSRTIIIAVSLSSLSLSGALRRGVTVYTFSTPAGSLFVPAVGSRGEGGKTSIHRRKQCCTITTPHRKSAGSKTGSNSPFTKRFHASEAAAANSGASPIHPARRRKPQKPTLSAKPSAKRSSPSACSTTEEVLTIQVI